MSMANPKKRKYYVTADLQTVYGDRTFEVEATNERQAIYLAASGRGNEIRTTVEVGRLGRFRVDYDYKPRSES